MVYATMRESHVWDVIDDLKCFRS